MHGSWRRSGGHYKHARTQFYWTYDCVSKLVEYHIGFQQQIQGGAKGAMSPSPVQISHKKMATKGGHIDFMFLGPPYLAAGSDAGLHLKWLWSLNLYYVSEAPSYQSTTITMIEQTSIPLGCVRPAHHHSVVPIRGVSPRQRPPRRNIGPDTDPQEGTWELSEGDIIQRAPLFLWTDKHL